MRELGEVVCSEIVSATPVSAQPQGPVGRLVRRADFLRVGKGRRWHGEAFSLQCAAQPVADAGASPGSPRVGFTLTKKVGNAVVRNRARRRLREAVRLCRDLSLQPGYDYVLVGRLPAIRFGFDDLLGEVGRAVRAVHASRRSGAEARRPETRGPEQGKTRREP